MMTQTRNGSRRGPYLNDGERSSVPDGPSAAGCFRSLTRLSPKAAVLLAIAFGLCGGYLDLSLILVRKTLWRETLSLQNGRDFAWTIPLSLAILMLIPAFLIATLNWLRPRLISVCGSAQGLMLGYLEQTPLYNAANFSWAVAGSQANYIAFSINSTSSLAIINSFICPSDGMSPVDPSGSYKMWTGVTNNYFASLGTTTNYHGPVGNVPDTTGLFTQGGRAYGIQNVTDGSSNTIAFGESLVGDNTIEQVKWRDGPVLLTASATGANGLADVSTNVAATLADLQACAVAFLAQTTVSPGNVNLKGFRWGESEGGFALFNTIIPPSLTTYNYAWCRPGGASNSTEASDGMYQGSSSNHPGGANFLFADGSVHFLKSTISLATYWAMGTKSNGEIVSSDSY